MNETLIALLVACATALGGWALERRSNRRREGQLRLALVQVAHCGAACLACRDAARRALGLAPLFRSTRADRRQERVRWN